jgi:hypothetical protein
MSYIAVDGSHCHCKSLSFLIPNPKQHVTTNLFTKKEALNVLYHCW